MGLGGGLRAVSFRSRGPGDVERRIEYGIGLTIKGVVSMRGASCGRCTSTSGDSGWSRYSSDDCFGRPRGGGSWMFPTFRDGGGLRRPVEDV